MSSSHHGSGPEFPQNELMKQFTEQLEGRAKRKWPEGRVSGDDDGQLTYAVAGDPEKELVMLDFGKPVEWLGLPPQQAIELAQSLIKHARRISKGPIRISLN